MTRGSVNSRTGEDRCPKKKEKWIKIAEGEDDFIGHWDDDFAPVMNQIDSYVSAIDAEQLDLDWDEICDRMPYLKEKPWASAPKRIFS